MNLNLSKPITINVWDVVFLPVCVGGFAMFYFLGSGVERVLGSLWFVFSFAYLIWSISVDVRTTNSGNSEVDR
jgi:hypothetical protein